MQTLISTYGATPIKELLRAFNSNKEYLNFKVSIFNVGAAISINCTDNYCTPYDNGYDFIIENGFDANEDIAKAIVNLDVNTDELSKHYKSIYKKAIFGRE